VNRFNRSNPGPGKVHRIPNRGCVSYSAGSGKVVERVKAVRAKSVSFGESDSIQKERAERHYEAVRATLQGSGAGTGYGTLQQQVQHVKYRDSHYAKAIAKELPPSSYVQIKDQSKEAKPNGHYHKGVRPLTTFELYSTDFNEVCSTKKISAEGLGITYQHGDSSYVARDQAMKTAYDREMLSTDEATLTRLQTRSGTMPSFQSNNKQHVSGRERLPRPLTAHELALTGLASRTDDLKMYKSSNAEIAYAQGSLPSKHRPRRPATTHECTMADYYGQVYSDRSMMHSRQANATHDFNTLQKQGAALRQATIPHGYRTCSYRMAMTGQKHSKVLSDVTKSSYETIGEAAPLSSVENRTLYNVAAADYSKNGKLKKYDDYVSMENLHANASAVAAKHAITTDAKCSSRISIENRGKGDAQAILSHENSKKSISVPISGGNKPQLKSILKNHVKRTEMNGKSGVSTFCDRQLPPNKASPINQVEIKHTSPSSKSDGNISTIERNGILLTSFPVSPENQVPKGVASNHEILKSDPVSTKATIVHHKALIHHSSNETSKDPKGLGHDTSNGHVTTKSSPKRILSEKIAAAVSSHEKCSEKAEPKAINLEPKSENSCLNPKKPFWPAPPPPLEDALKTNSSKSGESGSTLTRSHKRRAPPVPTKGSPTKITENSTSPVSPYRQRSSSLKDSQSKQTDCNVSSDQINAAKEKKTEEGEPLKINGELIEYLRRIAQRGVEMSSDKSLDSKERNIDTVANDPDYVNYDWYNQHYANHGDNNSNTNYSEDDYFSDDDDEFDDDFVDDSDIDENNIHER
jgi:hypothetical protein